DVPHRVLERTHRGEVGGTLPRSQPIHRHPVELDVARVLAQDRAGALLDRAEHGKLLAFERGFADAADALVGVDADEDEVGAVRGAANLFDFSDLHDPILPPESRCGSILNNPPRTRRRGSSRNGPAGPAARGSELRAGDGWTHVDGRRSL